jgi:hypothetical protein
VNPFPSQQPPARSVPAQPSYQTYPKTDYGQPAHARPAASQPSPAAEPQWPSTTPPTAGPGPTGQPIPPASAASVPRPTGPAAPQPPAPSADPYAGQGSRTAVPPWSRPDDQPTEQVPGLLPDGRPQLRRRTPQGHISARLIQDEGQQSQHGAGALSPTMMSDFWQGLSAGTAPTDPPAAGPDPSQQDRTTANRQEWNQ